MRVASGENEPCTALLRGKGVANPLATILSVAMMLRYSLRQEKSALRVEAAVTTVLRDGLRTADIHTAGTKRVGTQEMGDAVLNALEQVVAKEKDKERA